MPPLTIDLGDEQKRVDELLATGEYASASDVLRAALLALEREKADLDGLLRRSVGAALNDPRPLIPASEVFARLDRKHADRTRAGGV
jgi:antitoxin ParD1/3/4